MKLKELCAILERDYPNDLAAPWDHVGLLVGDPDADIQRVYLSLDADDAACAAAAEAHAELILTHHPLIFEPLERVTEDAFLTRRIRHLIKADINVYAMHTNFDMLKMGELNADDLGLRDTAVLEELFPATDTQEARGFGKIGKLGESMTLQAFAEHVKQVMCLPCVRVYGDPGQMVHTVAVSSGAGRSGIPFAIEKGADVMVTGDLSYHHAIDANAAGLSMIDAGHYGTEFDFIRYMESYLRDKAPALQVIARSIAQPYGII